MISSGSGSETVQVEASSSAWKPTGRLYAIIVGLGIANLLCALENTVVAIAAPVILTDLDLGVDFIWITNAFFLCGTAVLPLFGQFCNVFGRRSVTLAAILIFILGSGICGGASSGAMLIAGRAIQGAGSGGIVLVSSVVISDLVPLRQRGAFSAILMATFGVGAALGPFIGGAIVSSTSWRWVFYLNLPIGAVAFIWLFVFLRVKHTKTATFMENLRKLDLVGSAILIASTVAILYGLTYAGTRYAWSPWRTLVPLIFGFAGLALFWLTQSVSFFTSEPLMPPRFFKQSTPIILAVITFIFSALFYWALFFLPVYFQAVKLYSPRRSGVAMLPFSLVGIPGSIAGALALVRWGRYKPVHIVAFSISMIGWGLLTIQWEGTSIAEWAIFQIILTTGGGLIFTTRLPPFQAFLNQRDMAACTSVWYFIRGFGQIWGVAIPAAIFNNRVDTLLAQGAVSNIAAASELASGRAFASASAAFIQNFSPQVQVELQALYKVALQRVFQVATGLTGLALLLCVFEKEIPLRKTLDTEFGFEEEREKEPSSQQPVVRASETRQS